jgi:hypothetical protein
MRIWTLILAIVLFVPAVLFVLPGFSFQLFYTPVHKYMVSGVLAAAGIALLWFSFAD